MARKQRITDWSRRWMRTLVDKSPIAPLSTKEKRFLSGLNDLFSTLIGYIVVISILLDDVHHLHHHTFIRATLIALIVCVLIVMILKWATQLLATRAAINPFVYVSIIMTIIFAVVMTFVFGM